MKTNFTPGPLEFDPEEMTISMQGAQIAIVYGEEEFPCLEEDERDHVQREAEVTGFLFAAAPEMYEALKAIIGELPSKREWLDPVTEAMAKQAIAKAQGGAQ